MLNFSIEPVKLELKYTWKISRNSSDYKINFIVTVKDNDVVGRGEVAPNIRYNETPEIIQNEFERVQNLNPGNLISIQLFTDYLNNLHLPNALRFGLEQAYVHYHCKKNKISLCDFLNINAPTPIATCYTLPIMDAGLIKKFYNENNLQRFSFLKIKVNAETGFEDVKTLCALTDKPIMIDGNEAWKDADEALRFVNEIKKLNIEFVEQPMPSSMNDEYIYLKNHSPLPLMADESVLANPDFDLLEKQFHAVNMKLMKAGGYLNGVRILNEARKRNMKTMIGCMVETTLGISGAMQLSAGINYLDVDGYMIIKDEPFEFVKESNGIVQLRIAE